MKKWKLVQWPLKSPLALTTVKLTRRTKIMISVLFSSKAFLVAVFSSFQFSCFFFCEKRFVNERNISGVIFMWVLFCFKGVKRDEILMKKEQREKEAKKEYSSIFEEYTKDSWKIVFCIKKKPVTYSDGSRWLTVGGFWMFQYITGGESWFYQPGFFLNCAFYQSQQ